MKTTLTRRLVHTFLLFGVNVYGQVALAQEVQEYSFQENQVYKIRTALGITTQIEISPREQIKDYSTGYSNGWDLARRDNVFYVKPKDEHVDTNMHIRTAAHDYIIELEVVSSKWKTLDQAKSQGAQYKVSFKYPNDTNFAPLDVADTGVSPLIDSRKNYNMNYDFSAATDSQWLVPLKVYDDGKFTYIHMKDLSSLPTGNFPTVYARKTQNGEEFVLNTNVEGNIIIAHGTYSYLVVRHGNNVVGLRRN